MLRLRQKELLQRIFNLNEEVPQGAHGISLKWKALVFDDRGLYILSTLMKVSRLLEVGVSSYSHIRSKRECVPGVDAVYFIEPTEENFQKIAEDCENQLYDKMNINFISPVSDDALEQLAVQVAQRCDGSCINSVFDQFVDFSSPDVSLFTLFDHASDSTMRDIFGFKTTDERLMNCCRSIASGLASVFLTYGEVPRVLYQSGNELVSKVIDDFCDKIKYFSQNFEFWESRRSKTTTSRFPLLIVYDRSCDFAGQLLHPSTYQALIHDNFGIFRNEVKIDDKSYDLDCDIDKFWSENRMEIFGKVCSKVGEDVQEFTNKFGSIENDISGTISNIHELSHQRISLMSHTKIAQALSSEIVKRKADQLFKFEEDMFVRSDVTVDKLINMLNSTPEKIDKLRCAAIAYFCNIIQKDDFKRIEEIIGESLSFLDNYYNSFKFGNKRGTGYVGRILKHVGGQYTSNSVSQRLPVVEKTRRIIEESIEGYTLKNPLTGKNEDPNQKMGSIFVFVIGSGNYVEYSGLQSLARDNNIEITYGCTSLTRPNDFLDVLMHMND